MEAVTGMSNSFRIKISAKSRRVFTIGPSAINIV